MPKACAHIQERVYRAYLNRTVISLYRARTNSTLMGVQSQLHLSQENKCTDEKFHLKCKQRKKET